MKNFKNIRKFLVSLFAITLITTALVGQSIAPTVSLALEDEKTSTVVTSSTVVDISEITVVSALEATPDLGIIETAQYTGSVVWALTPASDLSVEAIITLTAKTGFTLTGVTEDFFTVEGANSATNAVDSGVVTAVFTNTDSTVLILR